MWGIRFSLEQRNQIEAFAASNSIPRAEAIRQLVERGLRPDLPTRRISME